MSKPKTPRFDLTFGKKDEDLYKYIESFGLPKAAIVKKIIREHMENNTAGAQPTPTATTTPEVVTPPQPVEVKFEPVVEVSETTGVLEKEQKAEKTKSPFGGMAHRG